LKLSDVKRTDNNDDLVKIDTLNKEITKIDKQISNLVDLFANDNIPTDILNDKINGLNKKKESMRVRIEELGNNRVDTSDIEKLADQVDLFTNENIPNDIINDKINGLNKKKESMRVRIEELGNNRVDTSDIEKLIPSLNNIDKWDAEEQQVAIIKLIDSITLY